MDVKQLALQAGLRPESVVEHKHVKGADIFRIDLSKAPELRRAAQQRSAGGIQLPDGDIFNTGFLLDGVERDPGYVAEHMGKERNYNFIGPDHRPIPAWFLRAENYAPNSLYGALVEFVGFWVFDKHSGSTTYDLSTPHDGSRPWMRYGLGYLPNPDVYMYYISFAPTSGFIEVNHDAAGENRMDLNGAFAKVHFTMPNCRDVFPQAPDREFTVELGGHYQLVGTW
ncbi:hypothetical protein PSEMO_61930 [Pseudomonas putida]|uniref:Uncharacterized protein n=2 Tax=Pseudomonas putida TaxID=303 RepID=A0A177S7Z9_PSEPU|nr:hypothetical protein [Pseudomonas putida]OAI83654.1 hypothetical protein AYO28_27075 [Pseudomonas putida]OLS58832.1 hypothetical protein PSEMO_61930 [Pseudomonas putida]